MPFGTEFQTRTRLFAVSATARKRPSEATASGRFRPLAVRVPVAVVKLGCPRIPEAPATHTGQRPLFTAIGAVGCGNIWERFVDSTARLFVGCTTKPFASA